MRRRELNVYLDPPLMEWLRLKALRLDVSMSEVIRRLLREKAADDSFGTSVHEIAPPTDEGLEEGISAHLNYAEWAQRISTCNKYGLVSIELEIDERRGRPRDAEEVRVLDALRKEIFKRRVALTTAREKSSV